MKNVVLLGASGSIGTQSLQVIEDHKNEYEIIGISVGHNIKQLHQILHDFNVLNVCVADEHDQIVLAKQYPDLNISFGEAGLISLCSLKDADIVINALVGFRGLIPSLEAIKHHKVLALANKESLVAGGELIKEALDKYDGIMYPIDSEHSAIFQCLQSNDMSSVDKLIITASGGSFRDLPRSKLAKVTREQALNHPNWSMGGRITIDSATMMNKGFEVIEAHYLFDIPYEQIEVIIHRESIVHSMVQYHDHGIIAQLGTADMRLPIQYALSYPKRLKMGNSTPLDLCRIKTLHFETCDFERYPLLALAFEVGERKGNLGAIINGADECAVALFLSGKITFLDIEEAIFEAYRNVPYIEHPTLDDLLWSDMQARKFVEEAWRGVL